MRGEAERGIVVDGFAEILDDGRSPQEVARDYSPPLRLHQETARVTPEQRKEMLGRVLSQMLQGRRVGLVCSCAPRACHGDVIAAKLVRMYCEIVSSYKTLSKEFYNKTPSHDTGHGTGSHWH